MADVDSKKSNKILNSNDLKIVLDNDDFKMVRSITRRDFVKYSAGTVAGIYLGTFFTGCSGSGNGTSSADTSFTVLVFSDVHFDPFYDTTLFWQLNNEDFTQWAGIFQTSQIKAPSAWGNDSNYPLLALALSGVGQNKGTSPLVIFTGDILGHDFAPTFFGLYDPTNATTPTPDDVTAMIAFTNKTVAFFMQQVRSSVGDIPVMFAVGNTDSYTGIGPDSIFLANSADLYYTQFVNGTVDQQTFINTFTSGGYYSAEPPGKNLMVISLNTFEFSPYFGDANLTTVTDELTWFDTTLATAKASGKKVWLLMHVPPGADKYSTAQTADAKGKISSAVMMWNKNYQTMFLQILAKYPGLITHTFAAHTHMDEYRIMSRNDLAYTTPGIAPYFGNNPAFKIFTFSGDTLKATDYTSLNYDLATLPEQFNIFYTFSTTYSMKGYLNDSMTRLYPQLATNSAKQASYRQKYFSGHEYTVPVGNEFFTITDTTWPVYWAGIAHMDDTSLIAAVNAY